MKQKQLPLLLIAFLMIISSGTSWAQVTVGLDERPVDGAILQIKNKSGSTDGGVNADKGLGMPRVSITNLRPTTAQELAESIGSEGQSFDLEQHIGLTVYNITEERCATPALRKGLYVWNSIEWEYIHQSEPLTGGVSILTDTRNGVTEKYKIKTFGTAGTWMLENLRATTYAQGGSDPELYFYKQSSPITMPERYYIYPAPGNLPTTGNGGTNSFYTTEQPEIGILYNWFAATNKENPIPDEGSRVENPSAYIQGICPDGWHLPSEREFRELRQFLLSNPSYLASHMTDPLNNNADEKNNNYGKALKAPCPLLDANADTQGLSFFPNEGGFYLTLAGTSDSGGNYTNYGWQGMLWSSSYIWGAGSSTTGVYGYSFGYDNDRFSKDGVSEGAYGSVRCKKDD